MQNSQELSNGFAVIGDTQKTMLYQIFLGKEADNHDERVLLIEHIQSRRPDFVLVAGDMVTYGQSESDWKYFREIMKPLDGTPLLPVVGNHDYFFMKERAREHLKVFPAFRDTTWYVELWGPLAVVVIDSNKNVIKEQWEIQRKWFAETLGKLDADPEVKGILVSGHHPPFTNSLEISPHKPTQEDLLPIFYQSKKTLAYVSGHCHAYERFSSQGKTFIVSGGGGGPRQSLRQGKFSRFDDLYPGARIRPFHYLWIKLSAHGLEVQVQGMEKNEKVLSELETFTLQWAT